MIALSGIAAGGGIRNNGTDSHFPLCGVLHETSEIKGGPVINNIQKALLDTGLVFLSPAECISQGEGLIPSQGDISRLGISFTLQEITPRQPPAPHL